MEGIRHDLPDGRKAFPTVRCHRFGLRTDPVTARGDAACRGCLGGFRFLVGYLAHVSEEGKASVMSEPVEYLSLFGLAERAGIKIATARRYLEDGRLPQPDALIVNESTRVRGWLPETVDRWMASRPGRGARTDLRK